MAQQRADGRNEKQQAGFRPSQRVAIVVLDACGVGAAEDAADYGDAGSDTLGHTAEAVGGLDLPNLQRAGLGNIADIKGVPPVERPTACFGSMRLRSTGKDTVTGHWELCGLLTLTPFPIFEHGFSEELINAFSAATGRGVLGNLPASGTEIIKELGPQHMETGSWIVYTSQDSVFQIAAHEEVVPLAELYDACTKARELCNPYRVGRVIARPFAGTPGAFVRTANRHDYGIPPHGPTLLTRLHEAGAEVVAVGKIEDIFSGLGVSRSIRTGINREGIEATIRACTELQRGLVFTNLNDFDSKYGHRRDPQGFANALVELDAALPEMLAAMAPGDLLCLVADHGNDPTFRGTDHTREDVPLLLLSPGVTAGVDLGTRQSLADLGATVADLFQVPALQAGESFLRRVGFNCSAK